jgi:16S rRNA (guanine527-N7)-methyltransferase
VSQRRGSRPDVGAHKDFEQPCPRSARFGTAIKAQSVKTRTTLQGDGAPFHATRTNEVLCNAPGQKILFETPRASALAPSSLSPAGRRSARGMSNRLPALSLVPVSRETAERFDIFVDQVNRWRMKANLVCDPAGNVWIRHIADSAQILLIHPRAIRWLDIGSGAGFPGMVLAMQLADVRGAEVHCIESNQRKCAFLREAARATGTPVIVHPARIECINPSTSGIVVEGITARALAPITATLNMAKAWLLAGAIGIFPRGRSFSEQLAATLPLSAYEIKTLLSLVDGTASIIRVGMH